MRLSFYLLAILRWTWCLPQTFLGACVLCYVHGLKPYDWDWESSMGIWVITHPFRFAVSLGQFIFIPKYRQWDRRLWKHEYGHALQSYFLGPLYLIAVGIPSAILNLRARKDAFIREYYYDYYPENWADRLGGVG